MVFSVLLVGDPRTGADKQVVVLLVAPLGRRFGPLGHPPGPLSEEPQRWHSSERGSCSKPLGSPCGCWEASQGGARREAGSAEEKEANQQRPLELQAKRRSDRVDKEVLSDTDEKFEEDSEEEEVVETTHKPLPGSNDRKPPEPKGPPPSRKPPVANSSYGRDKQRTSGGDNRQHRGDRGSHRQKAKHRAGRKHQRIGRLEHDPELPIHRKLSGALLDNLASELERDFRDLHQ